MIEPTVTLSLSMYESFQDSLKVYATDSAEINAALAVVYKTDTSTLLRSFREFKDQQIINELRRSQP